MDNKKIFFSIIMPVFNTEEYLNKAINSILNQTFKDFEFILIDDNSSDGSYNICLEYAKKDKRIILMKNDRNMGVSATRNRGLDIAKGNYVTFIDSDDYIDLEVLFKVYDKIKSMNVAIDCLKYGVVEEYFVKNKLEYKKECSLSNFFSENKNEIQNEILKLEQIPLFGYSCNSFYYLKIIRENDIKFRNYSMNEDFIFNMEYFSFIKNFCFMNFLGYYYAKRGNNSLSSKKQDNYYELHMMKIDKFLNICNKSNNLTQENKELIYWMYVRYIYSTIERNLSNKDYLINLINNIKKEKLYNQFLLVEFKNITMKQKIMIYILKTQKSKILIAFVKLISWIKNKLPIFFAKIK
ncbi:PGL/p-HBAD biosynthesis glycosyltransferase Rv2957/MT3031 [Megamonas hypermegale]|uniref:PGL/p-HBAD biosynthesis glycosyltransferase Rv2957/MT3031 n=1 Tax=Megamonas hypermegale TaxID=158847 RepID=A0A378P1F6_9FIRM|nr:glycosyltransferase family 2 protein [Megamonas hypermegale]STY72098.1 PGL/p-HBAD biosynthesis glycosyltransferase Rv2957/MT3031 [Megamonas hypermegale]